MPYKTFAAINAGSSEVSMKVYEITKKSGIRELDHVRYFLELGRATYTDGKIDFPAVTELCDVLKGFLVKMSEYQADGYSAVGSSAMREASNCDQIIDQIRIQTGLEVKAIGNSEQRLLICKSVAEGMDNFEQLINEGAVLADLGAGSLQITVYEKGELIYTQNLKLGTLRIREILASMHDNTTNFASVMEDYIGNDIDTLSRLFLSRHKVKHLIAVGEEMSSVMEIIARGQDEHSVSVKKYNSIYQNFIDSSTEANSIRFNLPYELASMMKPALIIYKKIIDAASAEQIWAAGSDLCDGIVADYAEKKEKMPPAHSFSEDMIAYARKLAGKYQSNTAHTDNVEYLALKIFDGVKKYMGMGNRERLYLQMACILHDCGKFINIRSSIRCSFDIIMQTEFIGISEQEKALIADAIICNSGEEILPLDMLPAKLERKSYMKMLKLAAILRISNSMDRSHQQKIDKVRVSIKNNQLMITADTLYDITLEQGTVASKGSFFEEIYGLKPVLKQRRGV